MTTITHESITPRNRAKITNGHHPVKTNTKQGRRFRDLYNDFLARAENPPLDQGRLMALRTATVCQLDVEKIEMEFLSGKRKSLGDRFIRLNRLRRQSLNLGLYGKAFGEEGEEDLNTYLERASEKKKKFPKRLKLKQETHHA